MEILAEMEQGNNGNNGTKKMNTTIAIWKSTKDKLDKNRAPGQCYNGFICQLLDMWEQMEGREEVEMSRPYRGSPGY